MRSVKIPNIGGKWIFITCTHLCFELSKFYSFIKNSMCKLIIFNFKYMHTYHVNWQTKSLNTSYAFNFFCHFDFLGYYIQYSRSLNENSFLYFSKFELLSWILKLVSSPRIQVMKNHLSSLLLSNFRYPDVFELKCRFPSVNVYWPLF